MVSRMLGDAWVRTLYPKELVARRVIGDEDALAEGEKAFESNWTKLPCVRFDDKFEQISLGIFGTDVNGLKRLIGDEQVRSDRERAKDALKSQPAPGWLEIADRWWELGKTVLAESIEPYSDVPGVLEPLLTGCVAELRRQILSSTVFIGTDREIAQLLRSQAPEVALNNTIGLAMVKYCNDMGVANPSEIDSGLFSEDMICSFFREYPVLWRTVYSLLDNWRRYMLKITSIFETRRDEILKFVFPDSPTDSQDGFIGDLDLGKGDTHNEGQSVVRLSLCSGEECRVVFYKPHTFHNGSLWKNVLSSVGIGSEDVAHTEALSLGQEGVIEKQVIGGDITDSGTVACRLGKITAVLHALGANDIHHENLVFVDDRPCLVDLETLLHPIRQAEPKRNAQGDVGNQSFEDSVLNVGILPYPNIHSEGDSVHRLDISVIGVTETQRGGVRAPQIVEEDGKLAVRYEWGRFHFIDEVAHRSELGARAIDFEAGFTETYQRILRNRSSFIAALLNNGPLTFRRITRPTAVYGKLLTEFSHPDFVVSGTAQSLVHGKLFARFQGEPNRIDLYRAELESMKEGDIPYFTKTVKVHETVSDPVYRVITRRIEKLGTKDLFRQQLLILYSFATLGLHQTESSEVNGSVRKELRSLNARALNNLLEKVSFQGTSDSITFFDLTAPTSNFWMVTPGTMDLYSGLAGVVLAIEGMEALENRDCDLTWPTKARKAAALAVEEFVSARKLRGSQRTLDSFSDIDPSMFGVLGGIHLLLATGPDRPERVLDRLEAIVTLAAKASSKIDIVGGVAGALQLLLNTNAGVEYIRETAAHLCDLVSKSYELSQDEYVAAPGPDRLVGLSHGITGALLVLKRVLHVLNDSTEGTNVELQKQINSVLSQGLNWEFSVVASNDGTWPDYRVETEEAETPLMNAWCHGSFGVLVAWGEICHADFTLEERRKVNYLLESARRLSKIQIDWMLGDGFNLMNESICHGILGNLLCYGLDMERRTFSLDELEWYSGQCNKILDWSDDNLLRSGGARNVPLMGLYMGLSGMLYGVKILQAQLNRLQELADKIAGTGAKDCPRFDPITMEYSVR